MTTDAMAQWVEQRATVRAVRGRVRATTVRPSAVIDLASNDYLGLATDPVVTAAATAATHRWGTGARASRVVTGTLPVHHELEESLADLLGMPAAAVFSSGYLANVAALVALGGPGCTIVMDAHSHASLHDAAALSRATVVTFSHNDTAEAGQLLATRTTPRALLVTESVFSVAGDEAPVGELHRLAALHDAWLVVDEAHGVGVRGDGRGVLVEHGLHDRGRLVVTATLSKAIGAQGGAVVCSAAVREHLVNEGRSFMYDTALAPAPAAAALAAINIIRDTPERVTAARVAATLISEGCGVPVAAGAVQSVPMASAQQALAAAEFCATNRVLVGCFRPPSVPDGVSRLRLTASAELTTKEIAEAVSVVTAAKKAVGG